MGVTVQSLCNEMARARLVEPNALRDLAKRWLVTAEAGDPGRFLRYLVSQGALTEYQAGVLGRGNADQLIVGPYRVLERIGKGSLAGVYRAAHESGQEVAIKVLPPSRAKDPTILERFKREARLGAKLKHVNVARTFQAGRHHGLYYLVMELLDGEPLDELLARRGPLPPPEAARLAHQVLLALEALHAKGIVHRDIKPRNLTLVGGRPDDSGGGVLKLVDIGAGRGLLDDGPTDLTNEDDLLGTPEYMAPEQARDPRAADIRADIYSAGCVLYHALTGRPPFNDANRVKLLVRHATEVPRPAAELNPEVPGGLQQVLDWMLAKDPDKRYPTPKRAADALSVFLAAVHPAAVFDPTRMSDYLRWLKEQPVDPILLEAEELDVEPVPQAATIDHAPPRRPAPPPLAATVLVDRPGGLNRPPTPPPPPAARPAKATPPPPAPRPKKVASDEEAPEPAGISRRDVIMLAIGVGGLAVAVSVGMAIYAVVRRVRRQEEDDPPPEP